MDFKAPHFGDVPQSWMISAMAAVPRELKVKTLEGGDLTFEVMPTNTIKELQAILYEKKHCQDPIERKILKVEVLADGLLVDDDQTLEFARLLHAESEATVIYSRNEVEAATNEAIHAEGLLQVNIPFSLTEISAGAFENCVQVVKVAILESVTTIREGAFQDCSSLASVTIPESVTAIGDMAFAHLPMAINDRGIVILAKDVQFAFADSTSLASITIPQSVTAIGGFAFQGCSSLASLTIPESVTAIGREAIADCKSLESITLPESVTTCKSLASITIPDNP